MTRTSNGHSQPGGGYDGFIPKGWELLRRKQYGQFWIVIDGRLRWWISWDGTKPCNDPAKLSHLEADALNEIRSWCLEQLLKG